MDKSGAWICLVVGICIGLLARPIMIYLSGPLP